MQIREFHSQDTMSVIKLWEEALPDDQSHNQPEKVIRDKVNMNDHLFFVAEDLAGEAQDCAGVQTNLQIDNSENTYSSSKSVPRVIGTIIAGYDGHRGWLYSVAVSTSMRNRGTGKMLVQHALERLRLMGCSKVNLQVRANNTDIIEFYRQLGFKVEERISMGVIL